MPSLHVLPSRLRSLPRTSTALTAAALLVTSAAATPIAYEGFDLPAGEIDFNAGATSFGWADSWFAFNDTLSLEVHGVAAPGLSYPGVTAIGNAFAFENEANFLVGATFRELPAQYHFNYSSTGHLWLSALLQATVSEGDPTNGGFIQLILSDGLTNAVYLGKGWAGTHWGSGGERVAPKNLESALPIVTGETVFAVVHLDFDEKRGEFWINPDPTAAGPGAPTGTYTMNTDININRVGMWIGNNGPSVQAATGVDFTGSKIDEIRLGTTWGDVAYVTSESPYITWINGFDLAPADRAEDADRDGDGMSNLIEFVFLGDPTVPNKNLVDMTTIEVEGVRYPAVIVTRRTDLADVLLSIEYQNLSFEFPNANFAPVLVSSVDNGDGTTTVTYRMALQATFPASQWFRFVARRR